MSASSRQDSFLKLLDQYIDQDVIVAFSGGVDSTLLLKATHDICKQKRHSVHAVTFQTTLHPSGDLEITRRLAQDLGVSHEIIELDEMEHANIQNNPVNRCYLCKKYLFGELRALADQMSISRIFDGTNVDDLQAYRPGIQALRELQILSPLAEAGMTKDDIRTMAVQYNLSVADRPSAPCLATRFPYGTQLHYETMRRVERAENYLRDLGFYNVRVRVQGDIARIELDSNKLSLAVELQSEITKQLKELGFTYITLDLEGFRSGSMDTEILARMKRQQG